MNYCKKQILPDFLIVGAAKSATTSLHNYLSSHPDIFMSTPKEPKFFSFAAGIRNYNGKGDNEVLSSVVKDYNSYVNIFHSTELYQIRGESSADNLYYYKKVIPLIKKHLSHNVKIIILLRNPVDRAFSAYKHLIRNGREDLSFFEALKAEDYRKAKQFEFLWYYKDVGLYSNQVEEYLNSFLNVKICFYEEFSDNSKVLYKDILKFLNIDNVIIPEQIDIRYNIGYIPKNKFIHKLVNNYDYPLTQRYKTFIPHKFRKNIKAKINYINKKNGSLSDDIHKSLFDFFYKDIIRLESIINKSCSNWLS